MLTLKVSKVLVRDNTSTSADSPTLMASYLRQQFSYVKLHLCNGEVRMPMCMLAEVDTGPQL